MLLRLPLRWTQNFSNDRHGSNPPVLMSSSLGRGFSFSIGLRFVPVEIGADDFLAAHDKIDGHGWISANAERVTKRPITLGAHSPHDFEEPSRKSKPFTTASP